MAHIRQSGSEATSLRERIRHTHRPKKKHPTFIGRVFYSIWHAREDSNSRAPNGAHPAERERSDLLTRTDPPHPPTEKKHPTFIGRVFYSIWHAREDSNSRAPNGAHPAERERSDLLTRTDPPHPPTEKKHPTFNGRVFYSIWHAREDSNSRAPNGAHPAERERSDLLTRTDPPHPPTEKKNTLPSTVGCPIVSGTPERIRTRVRRMAHIRQSGSEATSLRERIRHTHRPKKNTLPSTVGCSIVSGTPERIRTSGLWLRRPTLYPAELRALMTKP